MSETQAFSVNVTESTISSASAYLERVLMVGLASSLFSSFEIADLLIPVRGWAFSRPAFPWSVLSFRSILCFEGRCRHSSRDTCG